MAGTLQGETVNVERNSIFSEMKYIWWDLNDNMKIMQLLDSRSLEYIKEVLKNRNLVTGSEGFKLPKDLNILDVGCGGGILTEPLAMTGAIILGIDVNKNMIEAAQEHAKLNPCLKNVPYRWECIEEHSKYNVEKYDIVILNFILHHAKNHETLLKACLKTLKPGGIFFVSSIGKTYEAWIRAIIMGEMVFGYIPRGSCNWNYFINCSDVQKILQENHCNVYGVKGMVYDIFSTSVKWIDNINTFYMLHAIKQ